jgi:hypothetical protein
MSAVMPNHVTGNSKKQMIRETMKIRSTYITLANCKRFGSGGDSLHQMPQF